MIVSTTCSLSMSELLAFVTKRLPLRQQAREKLARLVIPPNHPTQRRLPVRASDLKKTKQGRELYLPRVEARFGSQGKIS